MNDDTTSDGSWKFRMIGALAEPTAKRIYTAADFHEEVNRIRPGTSEVTSRRVSKALAQAGMLRLVTAGHFLNLRCRPSAQISEFAPFIRAGAVVSLQSVLGECGFLNNLAAITTAVVPSNPLKRPSLGKVKTQAGDLFHFYGLAEKFFPATESDRWQLLQPGRPGDVFRPEPALLHWLYLAGNQRSRLTSPPYDVDMSKLDGALLSHLAEQWSVSTQLNEWHDAAKASNFGEQSASPVPRTDEQHQEALARSQRARDRFISRMAAKT